MQRHPPPKKKKLSLPQHLLYLQAHIPGRRPSNMNNIILAVTLQLMRRDDIIVSRVTFDLINLCAVFWWWCCSATKPPHYWRHLNYCWLSSLWAWWVVGPMIHVSNEKTQQHWWRPWLPVYNTLSTLLISTANIDIHLPLNNIWVSCLEAQTVL